MELIIEMFLLLLLFIFLILWCGVKSIVQYFVHEISVLVFIWNNNWSDLTYWPRFIVIWFLKSSDFNFSFLVLIVSSLCVFWCVWNHIAFIFTCSFWDIYLCVCDHVYSGLFSNFYRRYTYTRVHIIFFVNDEEDSG